MGKYAEIIPGDRVERIIDLIQTGKAYTAAQLAGHLCVDDRTIRRDIKHMQKDGIKIAWNRREEKYEFLEPVQKIPKIILKGEDAITALLIASSVLRDFRYTPLAAEMEELTKNLTANLPEITAKYQLTTQKYSYVHSQMAGVDPMIWKVVVHGLNVNHKLIITYGAPHKPLTKREIIPLHLRGYKGGWYIIAHCKLRNQQRTFNMSRIQGAEDTGEEFSRVAYTFDPDHYFTCKQEIFRAEGPEYCEVKFTPYVAVRVREVTWFDEQKIKEHTDGSVTLCFEAADLFSAARFVLQWGGEAKALKPKQLVDNVRACIVELAKQHNL